MGSAAPRRKWNHIYSSKNNTLAFQKLFGVSLRRKHRTPEPTSRILSPKLPHPRPKIPNPKTYILSLEPQILSPKSQTLNPEPLNPKPWTRNPKSQTVNPKPKTHNPNPQCLRKSGNHESPIQSPAARHVAVTMARHGILKSRSRFRFQGLLFGA